MLTTRFVTGSPSWVDLGTPDLDGATAFYGDLFGWTFLPGGPEVGGYGFFQRDGKNVAGGMTVTAEQGPPAWGVYFQSPDADATAKTAEESGGTVRFPPMDVMDQGRMAIMTDPAGVPFGTWQPGANKGVDLVAEEGSLCWTELYTPDVKAATDFYGEVFGWQVYEVPFGGAGYTTVYPGGRDTDDMFGGVMPLAAVPSDVRLGACWLPYFEVADTDAAVRACQEGGGSVPVPATDLEGVGRAAQLSDPSGARFAVIRSAEGNS